MRFESKNGQMKRFTSYNFKNVPLTVATYHQQWVCYNLAVRPGQETSNFLYAGDEISSGNCTSYVRMYYMPNIALKYHVHYIASRHLHSTKL